MKVSSHKYFEDKGVALSSLIKKQSTKAQLDFCLVLTSPFEVNTLRPKDCTTLKYGGNIYCLLVPQSLVSWFSHPKTNRLCGPQCDFQCYYISTHVYLSSGNARLRDDKVWDKGDVDAVTTTSLPPPLTPSSQCVNNKITFSADEWRENAIKERRKPFSVIYIMTSYLSQRLLEHGAIYITRLLVEHMYSVTSYQWCL